MSIARVLSVSESRRTTAACGDADFAGGGLEAGRIAATEGPCTTRGGALASAGSASAILEPQRLQRTIRRFPRTFSSAICSCALQVSQPNCIRVDSTSGESGLHFQTPLLQRAQERLQTALLARHRQPGGARSIEQRDADQDG